MPSINIIGPQNGFGNGRDMAIVAQVMAAAGFDVNTVGVTGTARSTRMKVLATNVLKARARADFNLFLGPMFNEWVFLGRRNAIMPNPEFFPDRWIPRLSAFDVVLAKTRLTEDLFSTLGAKTVFTGFTSDDRFAETPRGDTPKFLHVSSTRWKGTEALLKIWSEHPDWPTLTVTANRSRPSDHGAGNIELIERYLPEEELRDLQNRSNVHICCSEAEGFGHYIVEAMSTGALVFTTDGPPMNELIDPDRGVLVKARASEAMGLSRRYFFDPVDLAAKVEAALGSPPAARARLGQAARAWFLKNDEAFRERLQNVAADWIALSRR